MQSKLASMRETLTNTGIGFAGSWIIVFACVKMIHEPALAVTTSTILCTLWSLIRGYYVRRYFNSKVTKL